MPLAYIIRKTNTVQVYGNYLKYASPNDDMITSMLHLTPEKNKLHNEQSAQSVKEHTAECKIDYRSVYNILNQICKDTDFYPYVKQHKSKRDGKGAFYVIHSRWLGPNHVIVIPSEAKLAQQTSTYDREKKAWN